MMTNTIKSVGTDNITSTTTEKTRSNRPFRYPATIPPAPPSAKPKSVANSGIARTEAPPDNSLDKMSRPSRSVPSRWSADGPSSGSETAVSVGS